MESYFADLAESKTLRFDSDSLDLKNKFVGDSLEIEEQIRGLFQEINLDAETALFSNKRHVKKIIRRSDDGLDAGKETFSQIKVLAKNRSP